MNLTLLAVVLVAVVAASRIAVATARAGEPSPSIADIRAVLERGEPREALKMSSDALRLRGEAAPARDRYELLMVRGEALTAVGLPLDAADAYEYAAHVAPGLKQRAAAHAETLLVRQASNQAAVTAGARQPGSPDPEAHRRSMRELYQSLRPAVEAKVHAAVGGKALPPLYSVLTPLIDLGSLELTADGTLEKSLPLLHELGEWASGIITEELRRLDTAVTSIGEAAGEAEAFTNGRYSARRGHCTEDRKALEEIKVSLHRLEPVTREGRQLAELLNEAEPSKVWKELSGKTSDLYARVESLLGRRY